MKIDITRSIDRNEWLGALHAKGSFDERMAASLDEAEKLLIEAARPRAVYKIMPKTELHTEGRFIKKHLDGCDMTALMAVTLGAEVDLLIRKTQVTDMALAVIIDAGASVLAEQVADDVQGQIKMKQSADKAGSGDDVYTTSRFSPGYGDYPISEQARVLRYLDANRQIGLSVTADSTMTPRKSITAVIGISNKPVSGSLATCDVCVLKDKCELRKEGKFCGSKL